MTKNNTALSKCVRETLRGNVGVISRGCSELKEKPREGTGLERSLGDEKHGVIVEKKNNIRLTSESTI